MTDSFLELLQCPVCYDTMTPPIFMCPNGHNICGVCQLHVHQCPVCKAPKAPALRNFALEAMSTQVKVPCEYQNDGCTARLLLEDMTDHLVFECEFVYGCKVYYCGWYGCKSKLLEHWKILHPEGVLGKNNDPSILWTFTRDQTEESISIYTFDDELFWISIHYEPFAMYLYSQYIGPEENCSKYKCEFTLMSMSGEFTSTFCGPSLSLKQNFKEYQNTIRVDEYMLKLLAKNKKKILISCKMIRDV